MKPTDYNERRTRQTLEEQLESIISGAALMADSSSTRDDRRERIIAECNAVRQALQDLLSEYMANVRPRSQVKHGYFSIEYLHILHIRLESKTALKTLNGLQSI